MPTGESPLVARRRVRFAVREARKMSGLTHCAVAEAMEWSLSTVIRIENGDVGISPDDLRPLLGHPGTTDRAAIGEPVRATRLARTPRTRLGEAIRLAEEHRITVRDVSVGMAGLFPLIDDRGHADAVLYSEDCTTDEVSQIRPRIERHRATFHPSGDTAPSEPDSSGLIRTRAEEPASAASAQPDRENRRGTLPTGKGTTCTHRKTDRT